MNTEVKRQLPASFSEELVVLVVGPEKGYGLDKVQKFVVENNRWIQGQFQNELPGFKLSGNEGLVLTMQGTTTAALSRIRGIVRTAKIPIVQDALASGQVLEVLEHMKRIRTGRSVLFDTAQQLGNGGPNGAGASGQEAAPQQPAALPPSRSPQEADGETEKAVVLFDAATTNLANLHELFTSLATQLREVKAKEAAALAENEALKKENVFLKEQVDAFPDEKRNAENLRKKVEEQEEELAQLRAAAVAFMQAVNKKKS